MRKALRIIAFASGMISVVATVVLGCVYLEDLLGCVKKLKSRITAPKYE